MKEIIIPRWCYKYGAGEQQIANEGGTAFEIEAISFESTIQMKIKDAQATWPVYVNGEILFATNQVKSLFIETIKLLSKPQFILGTIYTFSRVTELSKFLDIFNRQAFRILSPYILKDRHLTPFSRSLHFSVFTFLYELGIKEETADKFAEIFVHLLEYDNAYRMRFQDIISEVSTDELKSPYNAILRLTDLLQKRDEKGISAKLTLLPKLLWYSMFIPKVKKAWIKMVDTMYLKDLQIGENEMYWMCAKNTYQFMGKTNEERKQIAQEKGWKYPSGLI